VKSPSSGVLDLLSQLGCFIKREEHLVGLYAHLPCLVGTRDGAR
jgi:hypothetical protein